MPVVLIFVVGIVGQSSQPASRAAATDELDALAGSVAAGLAGGPPPRGSRGEWTDGGRYEADARLAAVWPRPEFREPLSRLLDGGDPDLVQLAARGLLNYDDAALRARVERMRADARPVMVGRRERTLGSRIARLVIRHDDPDEFKPPRRGLISLTRLALPTLEMAGMTVPRAQAALRDPDLAVRLAAYCWLEQQGLVLDTSPVDEAWPRLSNEEREGVVSRSDEAPRVGARALRACLERQWAAGAQYKHSTEVTGRLLARLAALGSRRAREASLALIQSTGQSKKPDAEERRLLETAFEVFASTATVLDVEPALAWSRSANRRMRFGGLYVLAWLDDPRAVSAVSQWLREGDSPRPGNREADPLAALRARPWSDRSVRWHYIRVLTHEMDLQAASARAIWRAGRDDLLELHATLDRLAREESSAARPRLEQGFAPWEARAAAREWLQWLRANEPGRTGREG